jgi:hypothetical protein
MPPAGAGFRPTSVPQSSPCRCSVTLLSVVQHVFAIAACDATCDGLVLGLWPGLKTRLDGPAAALPPPAAAKAPATTFVAPFLCADISAALVHAAVKPLSLKQGARLELYAAEERKLAAQLEEVPTWIGGGLFQERVRAFVATFAAASFGWLTMHRREMQFVTSKDGRDWLSLPPAARLEQLLNHLLAEADLAAICERTGAKSGAVFRITRQSIQQALHQGATTDRFLATLRGLSDRELPANVVTEIGGWSNSRKTFVTRATTLLVFPDAAVAARIRGLLPASTVPLNDTTLELTTPQRRKLEAAGIFKHSAGNPAGC